MVKDTWKWNVESVTLMSVVVSWFTSIFVLYIHTVDLLTSCFAGRCEVVSSFLHSKKHINMFFFSKNFPASFNMHGILRVGLSFVMGVNDAHGVH